jgi:hypothetical protein
VRQLISQKTAKRAIPVAKIVIVIAILEPSNLIDVAADVWIYVIFKPQNDGIRRQILPTKRFDYIIPLEEDLTDGFSAIKHLKPHISETCILIQDESFSMFTVNMDFIIIPGADLMIVPTPPVSKTDFQAWIKPAGFTHVLKGFFGNCKILNPFHELASPFILLIKNRKAPSPVTDDGAF